MSSYQAGFELDPRGQGEPKTDPGHETTGRSRPVFERGFELESPPQQVRALDQGSQESSQSTTIALPYAEDGAAEDEEPLRSRFWSSPLLWLLLLVVGVGGLQVYALLTEAFERSLLSGALWSLGIGVVSLLALWAVFKELRSVWQLKSTERNRKRYRETVSSAQAREALLLCQDMYHGTDDQAYAAFKTRIQPHFSAAEVFDLYEQLVLRKLDAKARSIVVKRSCESAAVVALSPLAWLDMAFTLARSLRMIREIAQAYGYHCGLWGRLQLYRSVVRNLIFIGVTDLATDALMDSLGAEAFGKFSAALGQGLAAGIYSTRLGYLTIKAVRPLPLHAGVMTLGQLRKDMVSGAMQLVRPSRGS